LRVVGRLLCLVLRCLARALVFRLERGDRCRGVRAPRRAGRDVRAGIAAGADDGGFGGTAVCGPGRLPAGLRCLRAKGRPVPVPEVRKA